MEGACSVEIIWHKEQCDRCNRISGSYYEGNIQVRADGRTPSTFEIETAASVAQQVEDSLQAGGERLSFISETTPTRDGLDIIVGSQHIGLLISKRIVDALGGQYSTHPKLVGEKAGRQLFRITYLVTASRYSKNDVVKVGNRYYEVDQVESNHVKATDLIDGSSKSVREKDIVKMIGNSRNAESALVVFADGNTIGIMDPLTSKRPEFRQQKHLRDRGGPADCGCSATGTIWSFSGRYMRARAVPLDKLGEICSEDWVDRDRRPYADGTTAWVPVKEDEPCDREIPERNPYKGRGFFVVGNVAVVHGKKPDRREVEEIVGFRHPDGAPLDRLDQRYHPNARTPKCSGEMSERWSTTRTGTRISSIHGTVMYSQGNRVEKMRMAHLVSQGKSPERVADMFAGIGYFSIPMAGSGRQVHAMEINPVAFGYLNRNIEKNGLSGRIIPSLGDCRELLDGTYDRIVMGHFDAVTMLPSALAHARPGTIIHVHSIGPVEDRSGRR